MGEPITTRRSLLVRLRNHSDELAWTEFVEIYTPFLRQLARRRGLQDADADDLVQEVLHTVAGAIDRWDPDPAKGSFRGWLFRIARNLAIDFVAAQRRQPRGTGDANMTLRLEDLPAPDPEASARFDEQYRDRLLQWVAERVRGEFSQLVWQAFWQAGVEGKSAAIVAEALGLTIGTVYQYKSRVVTRLRREVERVEGEARDLF